METRIWPPVGFRGEANGGGDGMGGQRRTNESTRNKMVNNLRRESTNDVP